ncbi:MAG: hypothetical protein IJS87_02415 [Rhodocyclaceae bacterium]|nr:hypothetical protein [Rhodocyclaceae bacterium]
MSSFEHDTIEYVPPGKPPEKPPQQQRYTPQHHPERRHDDAYIASVVEQAVDRSTRKVFAILGVDLNEPDDVEAFRKDLRFAQRMRELCEKGLTAVIVAALSAIGYAIVEIFKIGMHGK